MAQKILKTKNNLQNIIKNLNLLEQTANDGLNSKFNADEIQMLQNETNNLLNQLERMTLSNIKNTIKKRKKKRLNQKIKKKLLKKQLKETPHVRDECIPENLLKVLDNEEQKKPQRLTLKQCQNQQLIYNDAQRFLRTFELLKILHLNRNQDTEAAKEFSQKLSNLRRVWNKILQENTKQPEQKLEELWNEVFFGTSEKLYYTKQQNIQDFLGIRETWDSYLTKDEVGTGIPCGWISPKVDSLDTWLRYRIKHKNPQ